MPFFLVPLTTETLVFLGLMDFTRTTILEVSVYGTAPCIKLSHHAWKSAWSSLFTVSGNQGPPLDLATTKPIFLTAQSTGKYCSSNFNNVTIVLGAENMYFICGYKELLLVGNYRIHTADIIGSYEIKTSG